MNKPLIQVTLPDPLTNFAEHHPAWTFFALLAILATVVLVVYLQNH